MSIQIIPSNKLSNDRRYGTIILRLLGLSSKSLPPQLINELKARPHVCEGRHTAITHRQLPAVQVVEDGAATSIITQVAIPDPRKAEAFLQGTMNSMRSSVASQLA